MHHSSIYLDHAATTPLDPRVLEAMLPFLKDHYGNPSSIHSLGRKVRFVIEECRERVAGHLGVEPGEVIFTSGGTEANNTALRGLLRPERPHLITSRAEHESILRPAEAWQNQGFPVTLLSPQPSGAVTPEQVAAAFTPETGLVSLMYANNEVGTLHPVEAMAALCQARQVPLHCDAVQAAGLFPLRVAALGVDALTLSGHKFYGPKGSGVLYLRGDLDFSPLIAGGSQERRRRGGTENVAAIVGLVKALDLALAETATHRARLTVLRQRLWENLQASGLPLVFNTPLDTSAPHILNISFPPFEEEPLDGEMLLLNLDLEGLYVSAGSACTSGTLEPSHVLKAMGCNPATASATVRFSMGKHTTEADIDRAVEILVRVVSRMRQFRRAKASV